jgi:hypothetical protein
MLRFTRTALRKPGRQESAWCHPLFYHRIKRKPQMQEILGFLGSLAAFSGAKNIFAGAIDDNMDTRTITLA